ncbi:MAG: L-threonylcarbamoyladenylate synthase [Verrucomicrobiota bacterium]|nr:L-threonylcarbamoyladenylate synthase [Verrucomicrobiota bacterium]
MKTEILSAPEKAVELLRLGEVVALPTETVYGLAADALNVDAVLKIFEAKERPHFDPLIVHLPNETWLARLTSIPKAEQKIVSSLTSAFWPGPLTLVLPRQSIVPDIVAAGLPTVAVRISAHPIFREIISAFGNPLAAPSANRFGRISPTRAEHVAAELAGRIPLIIDGGPTTHGLESTIVAPRNGRIEILRTGPITKEELEQFAPVTLVSLGRKPEAPGQLRSHYAPRTPFVLTKNLETFRSEGMRIGKLILDPDDLRRTAANLFRHLRELDEAGFDLIVAEEIPETGLGRAIMDRLRRASSDAPDKPEQNL